VAAGRSVFDLAVVLVSVVSLGVGAVPGLSTLRLMRAFRAFRLFGRLRSLRKITDALAAAALPVCNSLLVMAIVNAIYGARRRGARPFPCPPATFPARSS
jgi:hypothetical protein